MKISRRHSRRSGQALVEYALILALIALVCIGTLRGLGQNVAAKLGSVNDALSQ